MAAKPMEAAFDSEHLKELSESKWSDHQIDAGWLCIQAYRNLAPHQARLSDLTQRARSIWRNVISSPYSTPAERVRAASYAASSADWREIANIERRLSRREKSRAVQKMQLLHQEARQLFDVSPDTYRSDIIGAMSEIVVDDLLDRLAMSHGRRTGLTLPAESWNDKNIISPSSSFDLWRLTSHGQQKLQVKSGKFTEEDNYDDDIIPIALADHWPSTSIVSIVQYLSKAPFDDSDALGAAESIQTAIDRHVAAAA